MEGMSTNAEGRREGGGGRRGDRAMGKTERGRQGDKGKEREREMQGAWPRS